MENNDFADICNGIMALRRAFEKHGMTAAKIELASVEQGLNLHRLIPPTYSSRELIMTYEGEARHSFDICGVIVQYPVRKIANFDGGFDYV